MRVLSTFELECDQTMRVHLTFEFECIGIKNDSIRFIVHFKFDRDNVESLIFMNYEYINLLICVIFFWYTSLSFLKSN